MQLGIEAIGCLEKKLFQPKRVICHREQWESITWQQAEQGAVGEELLDLVALLDVLLPPQLVLLVISFFVV